MYCGKHVCEGGGAEEVGENEGGRGCEQRKAARRESPSGQWHVGEAGEYEGFKHFC